MGWGAHEGLVYRLCVGCGGGRGRCGRGVGDEGEERAELGGDGAAARFADGGGAWVGCGFG